MDPLPDVELHDPDYFDRVFKTGLKCRRASEIRDATTVMLGRVALGPFDTIQLADVVEILSNSRIKHLALASRRHWISLPANFLQRLLSSMPELETLWLQDTWQVSVNEVQIATCNLKCLRLEQEMVPEIITSLSKGLQITGNSLERLSIRLETPHFDYDRDHSRNIDVLFQGLEHPNCKIWDLRLQGVLEIPRQIWKSKVRKLSGSFSQPPIIDFPKKLEHLGISNMHLSSTKWYMKLRSLLVENLDDIQLLSLILGKSESRLESLIVKTAPQSNQEEVVEAISGNFHSRLIYFKWAWSSKALEEKWEHLQKRAHLYTAAGVVSEQRLVKAHRAKLFVCGHERVGKTTLSRNLSRKVCLRWLQFDVPDMLQRYDPTVGIDLHTIKFPGTGELLLCDIAGQEEYHTFHHYFVRGSDMDLFLVLCKLGEDTESIEDSLIYWLRFIVSHQSVSPRRKPKVLIAVNDFSGRILDYQQPLVRTLEQTASNFRKDLDIVGAGEFNKLFQVVATKRSSLQMLKAKLRDALDEVLQGRTPIPKACKSIGKRSLKRIASLTNLAKGMENEAETKFTLACSHDIGKAIYFGVDHQDDEVLANNAILDVQWFVREVVAVFMKLKDRQDPRDGKLTNQLIQKKLLQNADISSDHIVYILKSLHYMGFLVPFDQEWTATSNWSDLPKHFVVPALLNKKFPGWDLGGDSTEYWFWGRRLECFNKMSTLLPSGVFAMLQVQVRNICKNLQVHKSFHLGDGWVSFRTNGVLVVIRVGGSTNKWMDRHWVDIMLVVPRRDKNCMEADDLMKSIKDLVFRVCLDCPKLNLVEMVMDPVCARRYVIEAEDLLVSESTVESLKRIMEHIETKGLDYIYSWPEHDTPIAELLLPSELQDHLKKWSSLSQEYEELIVPVYDTPALGNTFPSFENRDMQQLAEFLYHVTTAHTRDIKLSLQDMNKTLQNIQANNDINGKKILANCSKILAKLDVRCPRYPYLKDKSTGVFRYCKMVGRKVRLHYLCEHTDGGHQPEGTHKGVGFVLEPEWYRKNAHILGPAIDMLFFAAKLGASFMFTGIDLFGATLAQSRERFFGSFDTTEPSKEQIEELFEFILNMKGVQRLDSARFVEKYFGLFPVHVATGKTIWVCAQHSFRP